MTPTALVTDPSCQGTAIAYTAAELAQQIPEGLVLIGSPEASVTDLVHPRQVRLPQHMTLVLEANVLPLLPQLPCHVVLMARNVAVQGGWLSETGQATGQALPGQVKALLIADFPRYALAAFSLLFASRQDDPTPGIHPSAIVDPSANIHPTAAIGPLCYVGPGVHVGAGTRCMSQVTLGAGARIGDDCLLYAGVRVGQGVEIGNRVILQFNAVVGAEGFSYATPDLGRVEGAKQTAGAMVAKNTAIARIASLGTVILEDDVEIGACTTIDKATLGATRIARGTKIDNLVMIGHNNTVGENCLLAAQVGIAGSCTIGNRVVMAGQVGVADHKHVHDDAILMGQAGISRNVPAEAVMYGTPAQPWREFLQEFSYKGRLRDMYKRLACLEEELANLRQQLALNM